jgi:hypothetical protein
MKMLKRTISWVAVGAFLAGVAGLNCGGTSGDFSSAMAIGDGGVSADSAGAAATGSSGSTAGGGDSGTAGSGSPGNPGKSSIGGTIRGLSGAVVLQDNGKDSITLTRNGTFAFAQTLAVGSSYDVTVLSRPAGEVCAVMNGQGKVTGASINVEVWCAPSSNTYTIGGTVYGFVGGGFVLQDNGANDLTINQTGRFVFSGALASGAPYAVTVRTGPPGRSCSVQNGSGTVAVTNVTDIGINCR